MFVDEKFKQLFLGMSKKNMSMEELVLDKLMNKTEEVCEYEKLCNNIICIITSRSIDLNLVRTDTSMSSDVIGVLKALINENNDSKKEVERLKAILDENKINYKEEVK